MLGNVGRPSSHCDVLIVGGGPAGTSLAIRLALAGLDVTLAERARFPRDKLCGEFVSPECFIHFEDLGVANAIASIGGANISETVFYAASGRGVAVKSDWFADKTHAALAVSRRAMDACLLERVRDVGVDVRDETAATGPVFVHGRVSGAQLRDALGREETVTAPIVVDATGHTRALARHVEGRDATQLAAEFVAFKTHIETSSVMDGACEIYGYRGGYGGCTPIENGYFNLCFVVSAREVKAYGSDPGRVLREVVCRNARAREALRDAAPVGTWHAVAIERYGRATLVPVRGLMTIGDAAAFIDPFTGSGILMALESGRIAAEAILKNRTSFEAIGANYIAGHSRTFDRRLRVSSILRRAAMMPFAAELTVGALSLNRSLRRRIAAATRDHLVA